MKWLTEEEVKDLEERGFELSSPFDSEEEAESYAAELKEIDRDPSFMVSVAGFYPFEEHYVQVMYKYRAL